ncbi:hypothetical protein [Oceanirhabdus sp. W0125-5]|uniref:hypothetical protein n=1 Tax=Oceanirhabdus sp. W0125-5 TaxID=2999116 RepID=UPI0022F2F36A|nr:hypothetical protein [Oceanirhabdus sp. W0125-5]WBW96929.1 hypothetical protein OW730_25045 [Oceanirhabdus sp. W0125-5]
MKKLSKEAFRKVSDFLMNEARELEKTLFNNIFKNGDSSQIIHALKAYINQDGGAGNAMEPDFWYPGSTPIATSIALKILKNYDSHEESKEIIKNAISYLENSFDKKVEGWRFTKKEVNDYPRAPWWTYSEEKEEKGFNGNPSAEIIGYLNRYSQYVGALNVKHLIQVAIKHLNSMEEVEVHELYCYIRLYYLVEDENKEKMIDKLREGVEKSICTDSDKWGGYVPQPLSFMERPEDNIFGINQKFIDKNLDYLIDLLEEKGVIEPTWQWEEYKEEWEISKKRWTGWMTLEVLVKLKNFGRL